MKWIQIIQILVFIIFYSCGKCKNVKEEYNFKPEVEQFLGMYKPGNFWVFANADSSIVDTLKVINFTEEDTIINNGCAIGKLRKFDLIGGERIFDNDKISIEEFEQGVIYSYSAFLDSNTVLFRLENNNNCNPKWCNNISSIDSVKKISISSLYSIFITEDIGISKVYLPSTLVDTFSLIDFEIN